MADMLSFIVFNFDIPVFLTVDEDLFFTFFVFKAEFVKTGAPFGGVGFDEGVSMASQFVIQAKSVGITIVWCAIATFVLYKIVNSVVGMRVSDESERTGLDTTSHGETAYHS